MDIDNCNDIIMVLNTVQKNQYICASSGKKGQCQIVNVTSEEIIHPAVAAMTALDYLAKNPIDDSEKLSKFLEIIYNIMTVHTQTRDK